MRSIAAEVAATQTDGTFESTGGNRQKGGGGEEGEKKDDRRINLLSFGC